MHFLALIKDRGQALSSERWLQATSLLASKRTATRRYVTHTTELIRIYTGDCTGTLLTTGRVAESDGWETNNVIWKDER